MVSTMVEYDARRQEMLAYLGGVCVRCGSTQNLNFDHIDRATKAFAVGENWAMAWEKLRLELDKCQLLCKTHHLEKSRECHDLGGGHNRVVDPQHGTSVMYGRPHMCRCAMCKAWKREYRAGLVRTDGSRPVLV